MECCARKAQTDAPRHRGAQNGIFGTYFSVLCLKKGKFHTYFIKVHWAVMMGWYSFGTACSFSILIVPLCYGCVTCMSDCTSFWWLPIIFDDEQRGRGMLTSTLFGPLILLFSLVFERLSLLRLLHFLLGVILCFSSLGFVWLSGC